MYTAKKTFLVLVMLLRLLPFSHPKLGIFVPWLISLCIDAVDFTHMHCLNVECMTLTEVDDLVTNLWVVGCLVGHAFRKPLGRPETFRKFGDTTFVR